MSDDNELINQDNQAEEIPEVQSTEVIELHKTIQLSGMYENWFLDYASYVILERAVPEIIDGLKPVQRRILHAMSELDDGRYNKVANIIGHTMKYHPHGDASIGDALVQLGQKDLLIDAQGNWGNILTGDSAAAPRYIEARLSKFAKEVVFNPKTTKWKLSYDGRNKEPITLPVKFPLLLAQGVEGIAVGLASRILPHNFLELIDASVKILQEKDFDIYPDFPTGGLADCSKYNEGLRGGKVRLRAKIGQVDKKTLVITEIPFGTTTGSLIDTIIAASEKGKIKIRKIDDNTASNVEILIHLAPGVSPDTTIDALYAFTDCEVSISPNNCVIQGGKPRFTSVKDILRESTKNTVELLKLELNIRKAELLESLLYASLEQIFIENRIYHKIEESKSWEDALATIDKNLEPYKPKFYRKITTDDILRLTEIKIKRISKYNTFKAEEMMKSLSDEKAQVEHYLDNLTEYAIEYFRNIRRKYGKGKERKTELRSFDNIEAVMVAAATQKLYVNRKEGFAGTSLRKEEFVCDCSDIDDIIVFREDGTFTVTKVAEKVFVGENVVHIDVFRKNDDRTIYNLVYQDGKTGPAYVKRFAVTGVNRDKEYNVTKGKAGSRILYFTANPNGEAEIIRIYLKPGPRIKKTAFDYNFTDLTIKGRGSQGNILTKHPVKKITLSETGLSTLGARDIWFDESIKRLNTENRGRHLGAFSGDDRILSIMQSGDYRLFNYDLSTHFDEDLIVLEKFIPEKPVTAVYYHGTKQHYYLKRFQVEVTDKKTGFLNDDPESKLIHISTDWLPVVKLIFDEKINNRSLPDEIIDASQFIDIKSYKAKGKRMTTLGIKKVLMLDPLPYEPTVPGITDQTDVIMEEPENEPEVFHKGVEIELDVKHYEDKVQLNERSDAEAMPKEKKEHGEDDAIQMTLDF
ncbi:MAG TPA: DNA gyrase/topoisomerase IV subunit A [Lentimicrobium sp.]|nr:DNA gyrase/topoisomerase IV subunit A [Lentimicrobium sp.]